MSEPRPPGPGFTLSDDWRAWVVDNLLRGVAADELVGVVIDAGVPCDLAQREVTALVASPSLDAARRWARRAAQRRQYGALRRQLAAGRVALPRVLRIEDADAFFRDHWEANRPLVVTDAARGWPALTRWTLPRLAQRFGDVEIEVELDRAAARHHEGSWTKMPLSVFVAKVADAGVSNDLYAVARNRNTARRLLAPLFDDVVVDERLFDPAGLAGGTSLWIGPAGTTTPLHHDTTNILFHQIVGRKRVTLVPPWEAALLEGLEGFYCDMDLEAAGVPSAAVTLSPGEALFIPVGWYHAVEALDVSVSFSLLCFRRPNDFSSYAPGTVDARTPLGDRGAGARTGLREPGL